MAALPVPPRRAEHGREARREAGGDEHPAHLPASRLRREPGEPRGHLAVALPDRLRVVRGEQAAHVAVQPFDPFEFAVQRHGQRRLAVGHAVGFEFDQSAAQPVGLGGRCGIDHRRRRALGVLRVRHHRVAAREVVALRASDPAPRRFHRPRPPFERDGRHRVQAVKLAEEIRVRLAGRRQQRVQDHRLAVEPQVRPLGFEFRQREPPVHAAARRAVPTHAGPVDQFGEQTGAFHGPQHLDGRVLGDERAARLDHGAEPVRGRLDLRGQVGRCRLAAALPKSLEPRQRPGPGTPADRTETRVVRPCHKGVEPLDAPGQERASLAPRQGRDLRTAVLRTVGKAGAPEHVEVQARVGTQARQQPLPEAKHAVDLLRRAPVHGGGPDPARRDQFARTGQAGMVVVEPAPVGQLLGQRTRRLVGPTLLGDPHSPRPRIFRCHGSSAHLPGSCRAG